MVDEDDYSAVALCSSITVSLVCKFAYGTDLVKYAHLEKTRKQFIGKPSFMQAYSTHTCAR